MKRREFLKGAMLAGVATTLNAMPLGESLADKLASKTSLPQNSEATKDSAPRGTPDLVAVMGGEPVQMFQRALTEMGGIGRFVRKGQKVVVKPNIGWDKPPEMAANTNPLLVAALVRECLAAGAKSVTVFDHTCDEWRQAYTSSGIEKAASDAGAQVVPAHEEIYYREIQLPRGKKLKSAKIHQALLDCDVWFNVPILKSHGGARMTIALKNHMGIVWDRRYFHRNDLQQCIADICTLTKPAVLHIVDAYRVMHSNGPRGISEADVATPKALFMSADVVAIDTAAAHFFNQIEKIPIDEVQHIAKAAQFGLGQMALDRLDVRRIKL